MPNRTPDEIRNDIEQTREELGDTVEALAAKTDVKAQAHAKIDEARQQAKAKLDEVKQRVDDVRGSGGDGTPPAVRDGAAKVGRSASQAAARNPVPAAAIGGFVGGLVVGRLSCRRSR
jgi:ElaB/YqjD/DUF883 family membrane-anchored ribosome-binding protein